MSRRNLKEEMTHHSHHRHSQTKLHVLHTRGGVPYEVERTVCRECKRVLDERPVRRAAA